MATVIRPRTDSDVPAGVTALRAAHDVHGYPAVWPRDPVRWLTSNGGDVRAWVATVDGAVIGHVAVQPVDDPAGAGPGPSLAVVRFFVAPAAGGRGVGSALMAAAVDFICAYGSRPVLTVADSGDAAIRLYERTGWRRVSEHRAEWQEADGRHPTLYDYVLDPA
jgi:ribosomal protein S18 acetylase RimI-like enzyme